MLPLRSTGLFFFFKAVKKPFKQFYWVSLANHLSDKLFFFKFHKNNFRFCDIPRKMVGHSLLLVSFRRISNYHQMALLKLNSRNNSINKLTTEL